MAKSRFLEIAESEFGHAVDWYAGQSRRAADRFIDEVESAVEAIRTYPGQPLRLDDVYQIRILHRFPYFVAFRQTPDEVVIVAVRHTSQDQDAWKGR